MSKAQSFFAVSPPGLESWTEKELRSLVSQPESIQTLAGGIAFKGSMEDGWLANVWLRTATRVLLRLGSFYTTGFPELRRKVERLDWNRYLKQEQSIVFHVTTKKSKLFHTGAIAERLHLALGEALGWQPELASDAEGSAVQPIFVRIVRDHCEISLDTSGAPLYQRGYRQATAKAPIRENLAAAILMASGWDFKSPLIDPFCGSGTFAIEAAMMAQNIAPGSNRKFAFMQWSGFNLDRFQKILRNLEPKSSDIPIILASDRDAGAIRIAGENAERAGVDDRIKFTCQAVSNINPPQETGWIVTNPPYGKRIGSSGNLQNLYARFGQILKEKCPDWHVTLLSHNRHLLKEIRMQFDDSLFIDHGGLKISVARGRV
ncbi:class I SAM-dependent RNA methyltransferase [candidate division KSB1 bacterium]|nr:class I SAM-dependent RNA methyltransferase [candidate division KSB1 bacterium]